MFSRNAGIPPNRRDWLGQHFRCCSDSHQQTRCPRASREGGGKRERDSCKRCAHARTRSRHLALAPPASSVRACIPRLKYDQNARADGDTRHCCGGAHRIPLGRAGLLQVSALDSRCHRYEQAQRYLRQSTARCRHLAREQPCRWQLRTACPAD